jgi:SNARE associated Golgi protein
MQLILLKFLAVILSIIHTQRCVDGFMVRNVALPFEYTFATSLNMKSQQKHPYENVVQKTSIAKSNMKDTVLKTTAFELGTVDTTSLLNQEMDITLQSKSQNQFTFLFVAVTGIILFLFAESNLQDAIYPFLETVWKDPTSILESVVDKVQAMGPAGVLYFGLMYTLAEVLAIPAVPLTASAGYLFGVSTGTAIVLLSASVAATISFAIGRTILRSYVERILEDYPDFQKLDRAIEKEGFKLMILLRMSPVFPFALSNYLYGASSVRFCIFGTSRKGFNTWRWKYSALVYLRCRIRRFGWVS